MLTTTPKVFEMKSRIAVVIAFCLPFFTLAQEPILKAIVVNGTCMVQRGENPDEYLKADTGLLIYPHDKLIITGKDTYVGVVSMDGKLGEISKSGVFSAESISSTLVKGETVIADKYMEMLAEHFSEEIGAADQYTMYTGSVYRSSENSDIEMFLPLKTKITQEPSTVNWQSNGLSGQFELTISNLYDEVVFTQTTSENHLSVDFSTVPMNPGQVYRISVHNQSKKSQEIALQIPTRSELAKFETDLHLLQNEVPENSAIGDMVFATYFEENGLYLHAIDAYKRAIQKEPYVKEYQRAYQLFLYKVGLE